MGDLDHDGRLDLVVGMATGPTKDLPERGIRSDGSIIWADQNWADPHPADGTRRTATLALGDMNDDGLLDLAVGTGDLKDQVDYSSHTDYIYRNDTAALRRTFTHRGMGQRACLPRSTLSMLSDAMNAPARWLLAWSDMNGDGKVDSLASGGRDVHIYPIVGGQPAAEPSTVLPAGKAVVDWGDMDKDGYPDLAVESEGPLQVYHNDPQTGKLVQAPVWQSRETGTRRAFPGAMSTTMVIKIWSPAMATGRPSSI